MDTSTPRLRAWALIKTEEPEIVAEMIWKHDDKKDGTIVIVRTDIIEDQKKVLDINLIVPIDMLPDKKDDVLLFLTKYCGEGNSKLAVVKCYKPDPSQNASGYITDTEFSRGEKQKGVKPGRQDNSPGFNPWG